MRNGTECGSIPPQTVVAGKVEALKPVRSIIERIPEPRNGRRIPDGTSRVLDRMRPIVSIPKATKTKQTLKKRIIILISSGNNDVRYNNPPDLTSSCDRIEIEKEKKKRIPDAGRSCTAAPVIARALVRSRCI